MEEIAMIVTKYALQLVDNILHGPPLLLRLVVTGQIRYGDCLRVRADGVWRLTRSTFTEDEGGAVSTR